MISLPVYTWAPPCCGHVIRPYGVLSAIFHGGMIERIHLLNERRIATFEIARQRHGLSWVHDLDQSTSGKIRAICTEKGQRPNATNNVPFTRAIVRQMSPRV